MAVGYRVIGMIRCTIRDRLKCIDRFNFNLLGYLHYSTVQDAQKV